MKKNRWSSRLRKVAPLLAAATVAAVLSGPVAGSAANLSNTPFAVKAQNASEGRHYAIKPLFKKGVTTTPTPTAEPTAAPTTPAVTPTPTPTPPNPLSTIMTVNTGMLYCNAGAFSLEVLATKAQPNATIKWGDGSSAESLKAGVNTHSYPSTGKFKVEVTGTLDGFTRTSTTNPSGSSDVVRASNCIESVDSFGSNSGMTSLSGMLTNTRNISSVAAPPATVTDLSSMFRSSGFTGAGVSSWDVSNVKTFSRMFYQATSFNGDVSGWKTVSATDLSYMFTQNYAFNQDLSKWSVGTVTNFTWMFWNTSIFNSELADWDISKATDMSLMFGNTPKYDRNLNKWNVTNVKSKTNMFEGSFIPKANKPIGAP